MIEKNGRKPLAMNATKLRIVVYACLAAGGGIFLLYGPTVFRQNRRMAQSAAHIPVVERALASDPRFARVHFLTSTAECMVVYGSVSSETDDAALRQAVEATHPPVEVWYRERIARADPPLNIGH